MNLKFKKLYATLAVGLLTALSFAPTLDTQAALTAPASWTFKYTNQDFPGYKLRSQTAVISTPTYTRTTDGAYYNYTSTFEITTGFSVNQIFNRSNTTWSFDGSSGNYIPSSTSIGSDNTTGTYFRKYYFKFFNDTNNDYLLYLDLSNSTLPSNHYLIYDSYFQITNNPDLYWVNTGTQYITILIPAQREVEISRANSNTAGRTDGWYLRDLGVSAAYEQGIDDGYIQGQDDADLLVTGFSAMVGILVNFVLMIANLEVLGVSLMGILTIIILFAGIVWTLKLVRG